MKKILLAFLLTFGLFAAANAGTLTSNTPFGELNIEVDFNGAPPTHVIMPGATTMSGSFPVTYDDGRTRVTFPVYFDDGTTLQEIIDVLWALFS